MIDPGIALSVKPVQTENPLELFARLSAIKGQQQQQKINALSLLSAQRQMDEEDAVKAAVQAAGGDVSKALPDIMKASPKSGINLSKSLAEQKSAALQQQKAELDIHDRNFKRLGSMAASVQTTDDLNRFLSEGVSLKVLDPQTAQQIAAQGLTTGTIQWLDARAKEAMTAGERIQQKRFELEDEMKRAANSREQNEAQRKEQMFPVERQKAEAEAALAALKSKGQEPIQPYQKQQLEQQALNVTEPELQMRAAKGDTLARQALNKMHQDRVDVAQRSRPVVQVTQGLTPEQQKVTGDEFLKTLPPAMATRVKAIADGRETVSTRNAGSKDMKPYMNAVYQYDPNWSMQRAEVRKAFTTGKEGQNIGALNTAIVHLGRLGETAEALKNGEFTPKNELYNYFKDKFGSNTVTNFELLKDAVAGEMAAALKGSATDIEIANMKKSIRASNSPEQMRGVITDGMAVLRDKANTYRDRYHQQMPGDTWSPILPTAQGMLDKWGVGKAEAAAPIVQFSKSTNQYRYSTDGGKTWKPGKPQ